MTEAQLEAKLRRYAQSQNVLFLKFVSPGNRGVPDRLLIGPTGRIFLLEIKRPGQKPRPLQAHWLAQLVSRGLRATFCDSFESGKEAIDACL